MNTSTSRGFSRRPVMALAAAVTLVLGFSAPVHKAEAGVPVLDYSNLITNIQNWIADYTEYGIEAKRWYDQLKMMEQQMLQLQGLAAHFGLPSDKPLARITNPDSYMVRERCGGDSIANFASNIVSMKPDQDLLAQQRGICAKIQQTENYKYNEMVDYMTKTMQDMENAVKEVEKMRSDSSTSGENDGALSGGVVLDARLQAKIEAFNARMSTYDNYIASMQNVQRMLAQQALKGKRTGVIGQVVKTTVLKSTLSVD